MVNIEQPIGPLKANGKSKATFHGEKMAIEHFCTEGLPILWNITPYLSSKIISEKKAGKQD